MEVKFDRSPSLRQKLLDILTGRVVGAVLSFILATAVATIFIMAAGFDVVEAFKAMYKGAFGSLITVSDVMAKATPLLFTGLAVAVAMRAGLFNVGVEGQLLLGALAASQVGLIQGLPGWFHIPLTLLAAAAAGGLWGTVPAILKARFGAHEVITTIMLNYGVLLLTGYLANYPLHAEGDMMPATVTVPTSVQLLRIVPGSQLTIGLFIAIACAVLLKLLIDRSVLGYEIRAVGLNPLAAEAKGISQVRGWIIAMAIGGAMAGLAGGTEVLGIHRRFVEGFSPGYGFDGIAVALMGYNDPLGAIAAALVIGAIRTGAMVMDRATRIPIDFVVVIQGLVLLFLAMPGLLSFLRQRKEAVSSQEERVEDGPRR